ncbi:heptosyltransferase [Pedobacter sp. BAL39]|uniref:glycosyltransferase family 9 protein n=1 Tax=Pedobacter sp. BAL39 TaxID=391596 RepID=UPI000155948B|nr:glycosyltransferase family 9 protein [Pedobacter sp. BAL39]EDM38530.1 heptosyltransferase [Pedobacter sp. BAL39]
MPQAAAKILVIRFSAMGDVAMTAPILKEFTDHYPDQHLLMLSRGLFRPFFDAVPNVTFVSFDPKQQHKGFFGLLKLFFQLRKLQVGAVADLHNNLRSRIICLLFLLTGVRSVSVDKGRKDKKQLTRKEGKILSPLSLTVERYATVFQQLGFPFQLQNQLGKPQPEHFDAIVLPEKAGKWIGVSPFAQHLQKVYPLHKMEAVVLQLATLGHQLFIFGGTEAEERTADSWALKHKNIVSLVRKIRLDDELKFISNLDVMLSMDSSGMHLASLKNIPVVSVWGATHPYAGFLGYGQSMSNVLQTDLYCRPCSVYGNVPCYRGDFACMNQLTEEIVVEKVLNKLKNGEATTTSTTRQI